MKEYDKINLRIAFSREKNKIATDYIPEYADWLEAKCIEMQYVISQKNKHIMELIKSKE